MISVWDNAVLGCVERDSFRLDPMQRTAITVIGAGNFYSRRADVRAPITAHFQTWQTLAQQKSLWQWYHNDLAGGALPFEIALWLWDRTRTVRAHFIAQFTTRYQDDDLRLTAGSFEIERESIVPKAEEVLWDRGIDPHCVPIRSQFLAGQRRT